MGNSQSDASEREAQDVLKLVPAVGPVYSGISAAVYAGKEQYDEANKRGVEMGVGTVETAAALVPQVKPAAEAAVEAIAKAQQGVEEAKEREKAGDQ